MKKQKENMELYSIQISEMCRQKLLRYADSFYALAKSYEKEMLPKVQDRQTRLLEERLGESRRIIRSNMREMAKVMTEVASEVLVYRPMEQKQAKLLISNMEEEGIVVESPCYLPREDGRNDIALTMYTTRDRTVPVDEVADMISVILDKRLLPSAISPYLVESSPRGFVLEEEAGFHVMTGFSRAVKEGETSSGDNYSVVETENGKLLAMLSDGTGSGETAGKATPLLLQQGYAAFCPGILVSSDDNSILILPEIKDDLTLLHMIQKIPFHRQIIPGACYRRFVNKKFTVHSFAPLSLMYSLYRKMARPSIK